MLLRQNDNMLQQLWVEKYRPRSVTDLVMPEDQKNQILKYLEQGEIPHCAFFGPPGSGKTCLARILVDNLIKNDMDILPMNGSDSTGVENMRTTVLSFLKSPAYQSKLKIVYIDEFDYTTQNAQAVLRNMMETYADNARFIVTGNYLSKIMDPVLSRFTVFEMKTLPMDYVITYVKGILKNEKITYDENSLELIVQNFLPDVRKIVNTVQKNICDGKLKKLDVSTIVTNENKICGYIVQICDDMGTERRDSTLNKCSPEVLKLLNTENEPDYQNIYTILMNHEKLPLWAKIKVNAYSNMHQSCASPVHHFMAMLYDIVYAGMTYYQMFSQKK